MSPCVSGAAPGFDMSKTRSLDLTSKILKDRSPASTRSPIPPSGSVWAIRSAAGFGARCLEEPEITSPLPSFPPPAEEHAEEISKAATNTASIMAFFMGVSASSLGRPRRARLYDGQPRSYRRVAGCTNHAVLTLSSPQRTLRQHPGLACQETSTQGGRGQGVPVWIQRVEEGAPDGEDAALRHPEITELVCAGRGRRLPRSRSAILAALDRTAQMRVGLTMNLWWLGARPVRPRRPALNITLAAFPIALSTISLRQRASGNTPAMAFITRVAGVSDRERRQSRAGSLSRLILKSRGPVQVISISLTSASLMALPKKRGQARFGGTSE